MKLILIVVSFISVAVSAQPKNCNVPVKNTVDSLIRSNTAALQLQNDRSANKEIFTQICKLRGNDAQKIMILEQAVKGTSITEGIIYFYDTNDAYTFEQQGTHATVRNQRILNRYSDLLRILWDVKDSPVAILESRKVARNAENVRIYYIDLPGSVKKYYEIPRSL